jgi:protein SCO1
MQRRLLILLAALPLVVGLSACDKPGAGGPARPAFSGVDITGAEYARALNLTDADGTVRSLADFKGKVVVLFFGYTQCPDVCPTTLAELAAVKKQLGADGARLQGVFVSVDPDRDTPPLLKAYMASFDPTFIALHGTPDETRRVAKEFKVFYAKVPGKVEGSYTVDHTAGSYLFDAQGKVRVFARYGAGGEALAHDVKVLLAEG